MARPSDSLIAWLRGKAEERGLNTAALATRAQLPRARVRSLLAGKDAMLVDELLAISQALELSPADMGLADPPAEEAGSPGPQLAMIDEPEEVGPRVDPYDNHHRQLLEVAFALGCDFALVAHPEELRDSGIPRAVLDAHLGRKMLIQLDAAYHGYNKPRYDEGGITLTLSFDALYDVRFPWGAIEQVIFTPVPWEDEPDSEEEAAPPPGPRLRLV